MARQTMSLVEEANKYDVTLDMRMPPHDVTILENFAMLQKIVSQISQKPVKAQSQTLQMAVKPVPAMQALRESLTATIADNSEGKLTPDEMESLGRCMSDANALKEVASATDAHASIEVSSAKDAQMSCLTGELFAWIDNFHNAVDTRLLLVTSVATFLMSFTSAALGWQLHEGLMQNHLLWHAGTYALVMSPPFSLYWYGFLEHVSTSCFARTAIDQLMWQPLMLLYCILATGLLQGKSLAECSGSVSSTFVPTLTSGWMIWPICQYLNQRFIPLQYRTLAIGMLGFVWDIYFSVQVSAVVPIDGVEHQQHLLLALLTIVQR